MLRAKLVNVLFAEKNGVVFFSKKKKSASKEGGGQFCLEFGLFPSCQPGITYNPTRLILPYVSGTLQKVTCPVYTTVHPYKGQATF